MSSPPRREEAARSASDASVRDAWRTRVFVATWLSYVGFYFCRKPWSVAKSALGREAGFDAATLGTLGAAYLVAYAAGQFLAGALGTRFGPRVSVLGGMILSVLVTLAFGVTLDATTLMVLMALNGLAQATGWSGNVGTMAAWFHKHERGRVMGLWSTNFTVGSLASTWLLSWVLGAGGWRATFLAGAATLVAVIVQFWAFQRDRPEDVGLPPVEESDPPVPSAAGEAGALRGRPEPPPQGPFGLSRDAWVNLLLVSGFYFFVKLVRYAIWSWVPFFLERNHGLSGEAAGYYSTAFDLAGIPGVWVAGWMSDRWFASRRAEVALGMMLAMTGACGALLALGHTGVGVFAALLGIVGFSLYGPDALLTGAGAMDIGSRRAATLAAAVISGFGSLGPIVQELAIGRLYDARGGDLGPVFLLLFGSAACAAAFCAALVARNRRGGRGV